MSSTASLFALIAMQMLFLPQSEFMANRNPNPWVWDLDKHPSKAEVHCVACWHKMERLARSHMQTTCQKSVVLPKLWTGRRHDLSTSRGSRGKL